MVATHRATAGAWLDSRDDDHSSSMIGNQHSLYDDEQGSLVYLTPNNNSTGAKQGIPSTAVVSSSQRMAPPTTTTTAPPTTSSSSWLWCGLSALVNGSTTPVTESTPKRTMFDTHGTDVASLPTIIMHEPATSRTAKQDLAAPSTCTYAPYLKVEIPRVLVVLDEDDRSNSDSDDDSSAPSKEQPTFRKVIYVSQLREPGHNNGKPSLYLLRRVVARTMWQTLMKEQQQQQQQQDEEEDAHQQFQTKQNKNKKESYLSSLLETSSQQGTPLEQDLPSAFCLKYHDNEYDEWIDLENDSDLRDALRHPPKGGLRTRLVYDPTAIPMGQTNARNRRKHRRHGKKHSQTRGTNNNHGLQTGTFLQMNSSVDDDTSRKTNTQDNTYVCEGNIPYFAPNGVDVIEGVQAMHNIPQEDYAIREDFEEPDYTEQEYSRPAFVPIVEEREEDEEETDEEKEDLAQIELSLHRRPDAVVRLDLDYLYDDYGNVSYWRLIEAAAQVFHIHIVEHLTLFYMSNTTPNWHGITNDVDLANQLAFGAVEAAGSLGACVHRIRVIDSSVLINKSDGSNLQVPYGSFMDERGRYIFDKLVNCARMAHPNQPVKALTYLSTNTSTNLTDTNSKPADDSKSPNGKICVLNNAATMENAFQNHLPSTQHVMIHPVFQANPLRLPAAASTFLLGNCSYVNHPPRIRMLAHDSVVGWDVSSLVPGRYRVSLDYYRGTASGSVYVHVGVLNEYPDHALSSEASEYCRVRLSARDPVFLTATGRDPYDPRHFSQALVGEFELKGKDSPSSVSASSSPTAGATGFTSSGEYFVVAAEKYGKQPLMSIKSVVWTFLGI